MSELGDAWATIVDRLDSDGYVDGAINVLKKAGYDAWHNPAGHVAVAPTL